MELEESFAFHLIVADTHGVLEAALARLPEGIKVLQPRPTEGLLASEATQTILEALDRAIDDAQHSPVLLDAMAADRDPAWAAVFRRLNELRNGLELRHAGPLIIAVSPVGESSLGQEAPDLWSRRGSGMRLRDQRLRNEGRAADATRTRDDAVGERLPPPAEPAEFEWLCLDLFREIWNDPGARKDGRSGQPHAGVDIFGKAADRLIGVQCRRRDGLLWTAVTGRDLETEVENALGFRPRLDSFILATAGPSDAIVQEQARAITEKLRARRPMAVGGSDLEVEIWSWPRIWSEIHQREKLRRRLLPIYWSQTPKAEDGSAAKSSPGALAIWQEKHEFLQAEEALAADPDQKFRLGQLIEEAEKKIRELGGKASSAKQLWQKKLAFLEAEEAKAVDPAQRFKLSQDIAEAKGKLAALDRQAHAPPVSDNQAVSLAGNVSGACDRRHVFIGYRHQEPDRTLAHAFADALGKAGHEVFVDTGIRWGAQWATRIRDALRQTDYLLLLLSREAALSEMLTEEVMLARKLNRERGAPVILPVRLRYPFSEPLPYLLSAYLRGIQQESWNGPEDTPRLVELLLAQVAKGGAWAETPARVTAEAPLSSPLPAPYPDPRGLALPGGAIDTEAPYYVVRRADEEVVDGVRRPRGLVTVQGPRQSGKTSLILRALESVRQSQSDLRAVFVDFQALASEDLESLETLWRAIAELVADQLQVDLSWQEGKRHGRNLDCFIDRDVLADAEQQLLLCLDEVDRLFHFPIRSDFFASLRAFYNRGAYDRTWKRVSWLLGTSSEPGFFIKDLSQSPFNVGLRVELPMFTVEEIAKLARHFGMSSDVAESGRILAYAGGQPYLVHLLLYRLAVADIDAEELFDPGTAARTIFREHLHRFLLHFQQEEPLALAMKRVVTGEGCDDAQLTDRLRAAGLVRFDEEGRLVPLCELYADFFRRELW